MVVLGFLCLSAAVFLMALQVGWACRFALRYPARHAATSGDERLPRATVLLCIRGSDPSLADCLSGLLRQDYPHYDVSIIIDSADDPAWEIVSSMVRRQERAPVRVCLLKYRRETCSLKLSALVQAIRELKASTEVVALIDADVIPYQQWLRDLVRPLADPQVGATCGVRWYVPRNQSNWGTAVRALWNAAACTQMYALHIPWAGSMAFRAELFRKSELLERWTQSFVEDTSSHRLLRSLGLRLSYVPAATMVNHETIGLKDAFRFICRQLLNARLYHESWPVILAVGIGTPLALAGVLCSALASGSGGGLRLAAAAGFAFTLYGLGMVWALSWADRQINRLAHSRGAAPYPYPWKALLAAPLTQATHLTGLMLASFMRKVNWRGVTYEVEGSGRVRMLGYQPYRQAAHVRQADTSLI